MKLLFASDIHGSAYYTQRLLDIFDAEKADRLVLLGDLIYHGPRNDLPRDYDTKKVAAMLNMRQTDILCVRGNCDAEVDQMVLEFPIRADYMSLFLDGHMVFATHGHLFGEDNLPPLHNGDILIHGHTHIRVCEKRENYILLNPGSISLPKDDVHSYMIYESKTFTQKDIDGKILAQISI